MKVLYKMSYGNIIIQVSYDIICMRYDNEIQSGKIYQ